MGIRTHLLRSRIRMERIRKEPIMCSIDILYHAISYGIVFYAGAYLANNKRGW